MRTPLQNHHGAAHAAHDPLADYARHKLVKAVYMTKRGQPDKVFAISLDTVDRPYGREEGALICSTRERGEKGRVWKPIRHHYDYRPVGETGEHKKEASRWLRVTVSGWEMEGWRVSKTVEGEHAYRHAADERSALRNHHDGTHRRGDPLGVYLPLMSKWRARSETSRGHRTTWVEWKHPRLPWVFEMGPSVAYAAEGHRYNRWTGIVVRSDTNNTVFQGDTKAEVYGKLRRWYASITAADLPKKTTRHR